MSYKEFLRRTFKTMNSKFIGFDKRILPLLGIISLFIPAVLWWHHRWADGLAFAALLVLCISWTLSVYDEWKKLLPLEQAAEFQRENPGQFLRASVNCLSVNKQNSWVSSEVVIASSLQYRITIRSVHTVLWIPTTQGEHRYDMSTHEGQKRIVVSGEAGQRDLKVNVHIENNGLSERLLNYVGKHPCNWISSIKGTVIIATDESGEIALDVPESSVIITITGNTKTNYKE